MASLFLDHNLSPRIAELLRRAGHSVATAREMHLGRASDSEILQLMARAGLTVITADTDFVRLHQDAQADHAGVLLVPQPRRDDAAAITAAISSLLSSGLPLANELHAWSDAAGWVRQG